MKVKITFVPQSRGEIAACKRMAKEAANPETELGKLVKAGTIRVAKVELRKKRA